MTKKHEVAVDIDNTIHESDITMNRASMELFNSPFRWCQQPEWYTFTHSNMPLENALQVFNRMHDRDMIFLTDPYVGSVEGLKAIVEHGYTIRYFTDRKLDAHDDTQDWLEKYDFPTPENLLCCKDKRAELKAHADSLATIIDDRPRTMIFGRYELGMEHVFSLKQPYNRALSDVPGVILRDTWRELAEVFMATMPALTPSIAH